MTNVAFRPMLADDFDAVAALERAATRFAWSRQAFAEALEAGNSAWVMHVDDVLAGQGVLLSVLDEAHILVLSVHPAHQRKGLGRRLVAHLCAQAQAGGAREIFLEVRPSNLAACALYRSGGFAEIGRRKAYYPADGGQREDAIVMRCEA
ncbi:MAG: ribosomal protein S18-alanine N-acetyltransferase [Candidatus Dactylopiibacterium sp.]|nr:ribosomal protein S18-alanine N-acetyltransferase [Candidatus Dactylopiibacterium sp.]